jgi:hypothetical protein
MIFGYNTDVPVGDKVYHVQTEDRGVKHPVIDSVIYLKGRILDKRRTDYVPGEVTPEQIKEMVTNQHKELVEAIKSGAFVPGAQDELPTVELLNPDTLEENGRLLFRLKAPAGSRVQACLELDGKEVQRTESVADGRGIAELPFLLPKTGSATVLFRAVSQGATRTVKFIMRQQQ